MAQVAVRLPLNLLHGAQNNRPQHSSYILLCKAISVFIALLQSSLIDLYTNILQHPKLHTAQGEAIKHRGLANRRRCFPLLWGHEIFPGASHSCVVALHCCMCPCKDARCAPLDHKASLSPAGFPVLWEGTESSRDFGLFPRRGYGKEQELMYKGRLLPFVIPLKRVHQAAISVQRSVCSPSPCITIPDHRVPSSLL